MGTRTWNKDRATRRCCRGTIPKRLPSLPGCRYGPFRVGPTDSPPGDDAKPDRNRPHRADPETCRTPGDCGIPAIPSLPQRDRLSRTSMSSASLARSAASVSITSSSSMSVTCAVFCRHIFRILTKPERIARSTRITTRRVQYTRQPLARSLRSRRPVVCIIATNAPLHELLGRPKCHACFRRRPFPLSNCVAQM
jgi:hypothetical protein